MLQEKTLPENCSAEYRMSKEHDELGSKLEITVIVPVYQHWDEALELIKCLEAQDLDKRHWELFMVDNGSDFLPAPILIPGFVKILHCEMPGSYAARNAGIKAARGELIVFTDADCRPRQDWLSQIRTSYIMQTSDQLIAGAVRVTKFDSEPPSSIELYDIALGLPQERYVKKRGYAVTANLAVPRQVFQKVGLFDDTRFSGGDSEFCKRAGRQGISLSYQPLAVIEHPARNSWKQLQTKARRVKGGQVRFGSKRKRLMYLIRTFLPPVRAYFNIVKNQRFNNRQKLSIINIQSKLWQVEMAETMRLLSGKHPERR